MLCVLWPIWLCFYGQHPYTLKQSRFPFSSVWSCVSVDLLKTRWCQLDCELVEVQRCQPDWKQLLKYRGELQFEQKWRAMGRRDKFIVDCYMCAFLSWKMEYQHLSLYVSTGVPDCSGFLVHNGDSANATPWHKSLIFVTTPLATLMNRKSWSLWTPGRLEYFSPKLSLHVRMFVLSSM